jgi:hypothetical protein
MMELLPPGFEPKFEAPREPGFLAQSHCDFCQENDMAKQNQQLQQAKPPRVDEVAKQKQKAEEKEVAGRHKNDGQDDHKGNKRQPGTHRGKD